MKKYLSRYISLIFLFVFTVFACTKDFDDIVIDAYEFTVTENHKETGYVFEGTETDFEIKPEKIVNTVKYFTKYQIIEGEGYFEDGQGKNLPDDETIELDSLKWEYNYMPKDTGTHKIKATFWDSNDLQKELELTYNIDFAPFTLLFNKGKEEFIVNADNPVTLSILRESSTSETDKKTFDISYTVTNGTGKLIKGEDVELKPGDTTAIDKGTHNLKYKPETLGEHQIDLVAIAPDGATRNAQIKVKVLHLDATLVVTAESNQVKLDTDLGINLSLKTQDDESDVTYELTHAYSEDAVGTGVISDANGQKLVPGEYSEIIPGAYKYKFVSSELGEKKIFFDVRDSNGQVKRDSITINVSNIPFQFTGNAESNNVFINQLTKLNFNLSAEGNTENVKYNLTYEITEGNGVLTDSQGKEIENNTPFEVDLGTFALNYKPTSLENHVLVFKITDSYGQESGEVVINLSSENVDLTFNASAANTEMIVNQVNGITVSLQEDRNYEGVTYQLSYNISGGTAKLLQNNNEVPASEFFEVNPGEWTYQFVPELPGDYTIKFRLRDSNNQILEKNVLISALQTDYLFSAQPANARIPLGESNTINMNITPSTANNGTTYEMKYSSTGNGVFIYNGVEYAPGEVIVVQEGQFAGQYTPESTGEYTLNFVLTDSNGVTKEASATFTVNNGDYTFNVAANPTEFFVTETSTFNFDLNQEIDNPNATYQISYSIDGGSGIIKDENGNEVEPGVFKPFGVGATSWTFDPSSAGGIVINFTVRDNTQNIKEKSISLNVKEKDFKLEAIPSKTSEFVNVAVPISVTLEELAQNTGDTYQLYVTSNKNGSVEYDGQSYNVGQRIDVQPGNFFISYSGSEGGKHDLTISVKSSSDVTRSVEHSINFNQVDYDFSGTAEKALISVGESTRLNFVLNENSGNSSYKMKYTISGTNANILDASGNPVNAGVEYDIQKGNFSWTLTGTNEGTVNLVFTARNATGKENSVNISVDVAARDYNFTAFPASNSAFVDETVSINLNIAEIGIGGDTYTMYYSSNNTGVVEYNGTSYSPGQSFDVPVGQSELKYTGMDPGTHEVEFTVTSSSNVQKKKVVPITFNQVNYDFTVTRQDAEISVGETTQLNFNITENSGSSSYSMRYVFSSTSAKLLDQNGNEVTSGSYVPVPKGNFSWTLEGVNAGNIEMQFFVRSESGLEKEASTDVKVNPKDFEFSANETNSNAYIGENVDINFRIAELGSGGDTYKLRFSSSNNGTLIYNGNNYSPGQSFDVPVGTFTAQYIASNEGSHNIEFVATSSSGIDKYDSSIINISKYEENFNLNITQSNGIKIKDETFEFFVTTIATNGHSPTVDYNLTYNFGSINSGYIRYNGTRYDPGENIPIQYGNTTLQFVPTTTEDFNINFTVSNTTGITEGNNQNVDIYKMPTISGIKTWLPRDNRGGCSDGCNYDYHYLIRWAEDTDQSAQITSFTMRIFDTRYNQTRTFNVNVQTADQYEGYIYIHKMRSTPGNRYNFDNQRYYITFTDSNGQQSQEYSGLWQNDK